MSSDITVDSSCCTNEHPRVLIISPHALNPTHGTGVFLRNLFAGWPKEYLADIYSLPDERPDPNTCSYVYRVSGRIPKRPTHWPRHLFEYIGGTGESLDGIAGVHMTRRLRQWITQFRPQVIYSLLGPLWLSRLSLLVAAVYEIPLVVHIMDDYISSWPVKGHSSRNIFPFAQMLRYWGKRVFGQALQIARHRLTISDSMAVEYEKRYGYSFTAINNGVDPEQWPDAFVRVPRPRRTFRLLYAGSIDENKNLCSLTRIAQSVNSLARQGKAIAMDIRCPIGNLHLRPALEHIPNVRFAELIPHADLSRCLAEYDLLLLPYNFDDLSLQYFQYSWPTKIPEYMMSGTPIMLYGPSGVGFVEYAQRENWAYVLTSEKQEHIEAALLRLMSDDDLRRRLSTTARQLALTRHDMRHIRCRFQMMLYQAALSRGNNAWAEA